MPTPEVFSAGYLIFRRSPDSPKNDIQFLLMKHADRFDLPKGHLDKGENEEQAAIRELVEETGISSDNIERIKKFRYEIEYIVTRKSGKQKLKRLTIFAAILKQHVDIAPTEHIGFDWCNWHPPHKIQKISIDPLLNYSERFFEEHPEILPSII